MGSPVEMIAFGGGCFWCTEAVFCLVPGVTKVTPGYAGGYTDAPTYQEVCEGSTGHAEVVLIEFEPDLVSLEELLSTFLAVHDPTSLDRQGNDVGTQYRSTILATSEEQKNTVEAYLDGVRGDYDRPIVTEVKMLERFYPAEEYHMRYFERNSAQPYCRFVIAPKVAKARKKLGI